MPKFDVQVSRTSTRYLTVRVEAVNPDEATEKIYPMLGNLDFGTGSVSESDYEVKSVTQVSNDKESS